MPNYSKPSNPAFSINVPEVKQINCKFNYNFYVKDESVNEISGVPSPFLQKDPEQLDTTLANFNLRVPRFVEVTWAIPPTKNEINSYFSNINLKNKFDNIVSEDRLLSSKFIAYTFSQLDPIENAYKDINANYKFGQNQANTVDEFLKGMLSNKQDAVDSSSSLYALKEEIKNAIETVQAIGSSPDSGYNLKFYDKQGNLISDKSGFAQALANKKAFLTTQINALVIPDVFADTNVKPSTISEMQNFYNQAFSKGDALLNANDFYVSPIHVGNSLTSEQAKTAKTLTKIIGYIVDRYEAVDEGFIKDKTFIFNGQNINRFTDISVKYSSTYFYSIRTVAAISIPGYNPANTGINYITYLLSSKATTNYVRCVEDVPPPAPVDVNFVWDYKKSKLQVVWGMPPNSQRDIKQFQIFRRKSIYEPFELLEQQCFDFSEKKYLSGEAIDGNIPSPNEEQKSYVKYQQTPSMHYIDNDFVVDIDLLSSSKYIYSICAIDAHGYSSTYSAQFEVTFDFFKNIIVKKLISIAGAPKPYPNLKLKIDLFKDVIKVSGQASKKMKVYFKPECYKIQYNKNLLQRVVLSKQDGAFYTMQFINLQNQKSEQLKIEINDPQSFTK
jgi:hypothetical protein